MIVRNESDRVQPVIPLDYLLRLAGWSYRVFPLQPNKGIPYDGTNGCLEATDIPELIEAWHRDLPDSNWGLACGNGLFAMDFDTKDGDLVDWHGCDKLVGANCMAKTPSGGVHVLLWDKDGKVWKNWSGKVWPLVDTRTRHGYIVLAGSVRQGVPDKEDGPYFWFTGREITGPVETLTPVPDWLAEELDEVARKLAEKEKKSSQTNGTYSTPKGDIADRVRGYLSRVPHHNGNPDNPGGHVAILSAARAIMRFGLRDEEGFAFLAEWNANSTHPHGPESDKQLRHKWNQALKYMAGRPSDLLGPEIDEEWIATLMANLRNKKQTSEETTVPPDEETPEQEATPEGDDGEPPLISDSLGHLGCISLLETELSPPRLVVPCLFAAGLNMMASTPKCGKSTFLRHVTANLVLGRGDFARHEGPCAVAWLLAEDPLGSCIRPELTAMGCRNEHLDRMLPFLKCIPKGGAFRAGEKALKLTEEILKARPDIRMVVIDALGKYVSEGKHKLQNPDDMRVVLDPFHELGMKYDVAVVLTHHCNKSKDNVGQERVAGSHQIMATSRVNWLVERDENTSWVSDCGSNIQGLRERFAFTRHSLEGERLREVLDYMGSDWKEEWPTGILGWVELVTPQEHKHECKATPAEKLASARIVLMSHLQMQSDWLAIGALEAYCTSQDVSERMIQRARKALVEEEAIVVQTRLGDSGSKWVATVEHAKAWGPPPPVAREDGAEASV